MARKLSFGLLFIFLALLIFLSFFNRFQTDDFGLAHSVMQNGNWESFKETYLHWSGRYFSFFLAKNTSLLFYDFDFYPVFAPIFSIFFLIFAFRALLKTYFPEANNSLLKAVALASLYFLLTVNLGEHLYWSSAAKIYFFPFIYYLFFLVFLKKMQENNKNSSLLLLIILSFAIIGSNEIAAAMLIATIFLSFIQKKEKYSFILLGVSSIFFAAAFFAPGNFERMGDGGVTPLKRLTSGILLFGSLHVLAFVKGIVLLPIIHVIFEKELLKFSKDNKTLLFWLIPLTGILLISVLGASDERVTDAFLFFFVFLLSVFILRFKNLKKLAPISLLIILFPALSLPPYKEQFFTFNFHYYDAISDIVSCKMPQFKKEMQQREILLKNSKEDSVVLPKISYQPKTLYFSEIPDAGNKTFVNKQLEDFFDLKNVVTEKK